MKLTVICRFFLTTERSEVVPFLRGVWAKKSGREATPSPDVRWARLNSPVFHPKVVLNVDGFGQNLAGIISGSSWTD